jgi:hypothetical protein
MSNKTNPQELANKIQEENKKHNSRIQDEKCRHKNRIEELMEKGGIVKIRKISKENKKIVSELFNQRQNFRDKFYSVIHNLTGSKKTRICIDDKITIRDGTIYKYGKSEKADLALITVFDSILDGICSHIDSDSSCEKLRNNIQKLNDGCISTKSKDNYCYLFEGNSNYIIYNADFDELSIYPNSSFKKKEIKNKMNQSRYKRDRIRLDMRLKEKPQNLVEISRARNDVKDALEYTKEKLLDKKEYEKELFDNISKDFSKELVANQLSN